MQLHAIDFPRLAAALAAVIAIAFAAPAQGQSRYDDMSVTELDRLLAQVIARGKEMRNLTRLRETGQAIVKRGRCQPLFNRSRQTRDSLLQLNRRYQGRADNNYKQQAQSLRRENQAALNGYRECITQEIKAHHPWKEQKVTDYRSFRALFTRLAVELDGETDESLRRKADEIYAAKQRKTAISQFPFAELIMASNDVRLTRNGRTVRIGKGINVLAGDEIRTGQNGRFAVSFTEVQGRVTRGPYRLSVGQNTKILISRDTNMVVQQRGKGRVKLGVDLAYGSLRLVNSGAGRTSEYQVRAGIETASLPGGDAIVSYYPKRALLNVKLRSGTAQVAQAKRDAVRLRPNNQVSMRRGVAQRVSQLPDSQWAAAVQASGGLANSSQPIARPPQNRGQVARQDILLRAASREAVNRMLTALRDTNANEWLRSVQGAALAKAKNTLRDNSLAQVLRRSGRPTSWQTDCVACQSDGTCQVPTTVNLTGSRRYEAVHTVKPSADRSFYQVERVSQWTGAAQQQFKANKPLCAAELK